MNFNVISKRLAGWKIKGEGKLVLFVPRLTAGTDGPAPVRKLDLKKHEKSKNKEKRKKINKTIQNIK